MQGKGWGPGRGEREQVPSAPGTASCGQECGCLSVRTQGPGAVGGHSSGPGVHRLQSPGTLFLSFGPCCPLGALHRPGHLAEGTQQERSA